jgi:hypothetical protein
MSEPVTALTGCLAPIDKTGLETLIENGKANPEVIKTLKCKTVAEGKCELHSQSGTLHRGRTTWSAR